MKKTHFSLQHKLDQLLSDLHTLEHKYNISKKRFYGNFDPLIETKDYINRCQCGGFPVLSRYKNRYYIYCPVCGYRSKGNRKAYLAILEYNKSPNSIHPSYRELPVFNLHNIPIKEARDLLKQIRQDLEIRKNIAGLRRQLKETTTNQKYIDRLKAFLAWCIYAQTLIKEQIKTLN